jgi:hypothetical protein
MLCRNMSNQVRFLLSLRMQVRSDADEARQSKRDTPLLVIMLYDECDLLGGRRTVQDQGSGDGGLENAQSVEREPESALDCQDSVPSTKSCLLDDLFTLGLRIRLPK